MFLPAENEQGSLRSSATIQASHPAAQTHQRDKQDESMTRTPPFPSIWQSIIPSFHLEPRLYPRLTQPQLHIRSTSGTSDGMTKQLQPPYSVAVLFRNISGLGLAISGHGYMVGLACRVICRVRGDRRPASLSEVTLPGRAAEAVAGAGGRVRTDRAKRAPTEPGDCEPRTHTTRHDIAS